MKILVTGATGFVGAVLLPELVREHGAAALTALVLPGDRIPQSWAGLGVRTVRGDIADETAVRAAVAGHSHVIHMAGLISYWKRDRRLLDRVNRQGAQAVVEACLAEKVERLVHVSSVGAIGFHRDGTPADELTPFNWPDSLPYMTSKRDGQQVVETAMQTRRLPALILNPASIMGPGDHVETTPHNRLYRSVWNGPLFGSFSGGLAIVDVRDLTAIVRQALSKGRLGEKYLVVGANLSYSEVIRQVSHRCGRRAFPFAVPAPLIAGGGGMLELVSRFTGKRPLLTSAYGRLSGWFAYYDNGKSRREFNHEYIPAERTIRDGWEYYQRNFIAAARKPSLRKNKSPRQP
ncbi:MAG TPA: NAD-dependent epimerase/dehydratase family protein [Candidatus Binatia bacterium]|nr:NAD-dependent epimerase/dehydratase family protein [Candidatus Binatia bacterium]